MDVSEEGHDIGEAIVEVEVFFCFYLWELLFGRGVGKRVLHN